MNRTRGYERLTEDDSQSDVQSEEQYLVDRQYRLPPRPFPRKEIIAGFMLLFSGIIMITFGVLIHIEHWKNEVPGTPLTRTRQQVQA
jgi:hypothetical protein